MDYIPLVNTESLGWREKHKANIYYCLSLALTCIALGAAIVFKLIERGVL